MLTETDFSHCKKGSFTICPGNTPVCSAQTMTCLSNLFFQSTNTHRVCRRKMLIQHPTPTLQHHGNMWIFHFPTRHHISLRYPDTKDQINRTITLYGAGILHNTSECHITSDEITIFPDLDGTPLAELDTPKFYLPGNISIVTNDEIQQLKDIFPTDIQRLHDMHTKISTLQQTFDVDSLLHIHRTAMLHKQRTHCFIIITTSICATLILGTIYFLFCLRFHYIFRIIPKPNSTTCTSSSPALALSSENIEPRNENQEQRVLFASYPVQSSH